MIYFSYTETSDPMNFLLFPENPKHFSFNWTSFPPSTSEASKTFWMVKIAFEIEKLCLTWVKMKQFGRLMIFSEQISMRIPGIMLKFFSFFFSCELNDFRNEIFTRKVLLSISFSSVFIHSVNVTLEKFFLIFSNFPWVRWWWK